MSVKIAGLMTMKIDILTSILIAGCSGKQLQPSEDRTPAQQQEFIPSEAKDHSNPTITDPTGQPKDTTENDHSQANPPSESSSPYRSDPSLNRTPDTQSIEPSQAPALQPITKGNGTTRETTTKIKPITDLPIQKPHAPDQPANIWESLSPQEIDCLPESIHDAQSLIQALDDAQQITQCLTSENAFILHMTANSTGIPGISEETQRCIWKAIINLTDVDSVPPTPQDRSDPMAELQHFIKVTIGTTVIAGYCMSDQEWAITNPIDTSKERDYITCIVDSYGGTTQFLEALIEDIHSLDLAEAICDAKNSDT